MCYPGRRPGVAARWCTDVYQCWSRLLRYLQLWRTGCHLDKHTRDHGWFPGGLIHAPTLLSVAGWAQCRQWNWSWNVFFLMEISPACWSWDISKPKLDSLWVTLVLMEPDSDLWFGKPASIPAFNPSGTCGNHALVKESCVLLTAWVHHEAWAAAGTQRAMSQAPAAGGCLQLELPSRLPYKSFKHLTAVAPIAVKSQAELSRNAGLFTLCGICVCVFQPLWNADSQNWEN